MPPPMPPNPPSPPTPSPPQVTRETLAALVGVGSVGGIAIAGLVVGGLAYARATNNANAISNAISNGGGGGAVPTSATFSVTPSAMRAWLSGRQLSATTNNEAEHFFKVVAPVDPF